LVDKGWRPWQIAQALGLDRTTIRKYTRATAAEELIGAAPPRSSKLLDPHKAHLRRRTAEGCISTQTLLAEIRAHGFKGSERTLRRWLIKLRGAIAEPEIPKPVKVRDLVAWIMRPHENLSEEERLELKRVCAANTELASTRDLARRFTILLRERRGHELHAWVTDAQNGPVREIASFAAGLRKDWNAVVAGLTLPYSSGKVEGHVNKVKMLKRNMFGRANHQLLRQRIPLNA
jgi:transposase